MIDLEEIIFGANGLTKAFYDGKEIRTVVDDVSFGVHKGEMIAVMGPSGSGKSVLLNVLGGIMPISCGKVFLKGTEITDRVNKKGQADIGYAFQIDNLLPWRTVNKNLMLPLETYKKKFEYSAGERALKMLTLVGLENYGEIFPHELSGGMRQRVGFARSMMHDPDILVLDQPFGALDAITRSMMGYQLLKIIRENGKCGVLATNDFKEAALLASRVIFLGKDGKVAQTVEIDIPYEERDENIADRPGYDELIAHLRSVFNSLDQRGDEQA